jgi:ferrochelatase
VACQVASDVSWQQQQQRQQPESHSSGAIATPPQQQQATEKIGVLLLNLGGPDTLDDVQPFLYNLFADPDIIRLPGPLQFLQPFIASVISTLRAPKSAEGYAAIGGGSPLRKITQDQATALAEALRAKGHDAQAYVAMRYWNPYTEEALEQVKRDGVTKLVILPLYPQFSVSTSGSSLRLLEQLFKADPALANLKHTVIPSWYQRKGYVSAMVDLIEAELVRFPNVPSVEIFFSAHGVPKSYITEAGDPYKEEMEECIDLIMAEVKRRGYQNHHTLAYQSRVGPVEWLKPYTDDSIRCEQHAGHAAPCAGCSITMHPCCSTRSHTHMPSSSCHQAPHCTLHPSPLVHPL